MLNISVKFDGEIQLEMLSKINSIASEYGCKARMFDNNESGFVNIEHLDLLKRIVNHADSGVDIPYLHPLIDQARNIVYGKCIDSKQGRIVDGGVLRYKSKISGSSIVEAIHLKSPNTPADVVMFCPTATAYHDNHDGVWAAIPDGELYCMARCGEFVVKINREFFVLSECTMNRLYEKVQG